MTIIGIITNVVPASITGQGVDNPSLTGSSDMVTILSLIHIFPLNEVAAVFGLSPNYLSALFKKTCNIGFSEYITQKKVARAKTLLLEQDMKIYEVADQLGFESAFYFSKVFKKVEGISPREYICLLYTS